MLGPNFNLFNSFVEFSFMVFSVTYYMGLHNALTFAKNVSFHEGKSIQYLIFFGKT